MFFDNQHDLNKTLNAFKQLVEENKIRHIGLSNFTIPMLKEAMDASDVPIAAHQVENQPYLPQAEMREFLHEQGIKMVFYSPLVRGYVLRDSTLKEISADTGHSPAQIALAWLIQKGAVPIPKATSLSHLQSNLEAQAIELGSNDIQKIDAISIRKR